MEELNQKNGFSAGPSSTLALSAPPTAPSTISSVPPAHPSLPQRPTYDFAANADSIGFGAAPTVQSLQNIPTATQALAGSNRDVVANRRAIRMANMSAAEMLKAELSGLVPVKPDLSLPPKPVSSTADMVMNAPVPPPATLDASRMSSVHDDDSSDPNDVPGLGNHHHRIVDSPSTPAQVHTGGEPMRFDTPAESDADADGEPDPDHAFPTPANGDVAVEEISAGVKRKFGEGPEADEAENSTSEGDEDAPSDGAALALKVNPDGTVEQEDTVKCVTRSDLRAIIDACWTRLWEPGYKERYYRQKFGIELTDTDFRKA